jgi:uncharacterized protein YciI
MAVFAVQYVYVNRPESLGEVRPQHRAFLAGLLAEGTLLASGPYLTGPGTAWPDEQAPPGALLLVRAESPEAAAKLLEADPFYVEGLIEERGVRGWVPVMGPFSDEPGV